MNYTRIYTDSNGDSQFEKKEIALSDHGEVGFLSEKLSVSSIQFRENTANYAWDFHNAPAKQFIILLDGEIEITNSLGDKRIFHAGDILFVEDTDGKGHKSKNIHNQIRKSIFIQL